MTLRISRHSAAAAGHLEVLRCLLAALGDVNRTDLQGQTPLHCAAASGAASSVGFGGDLGMHGEDNPRVSRICFGGWIVQWYVVVLAVCIV